MVHVSLKHFDWYSCISTSASLVNGTSNEASCLIAWPGSSYSNLIIKLVLNYPPPPLITLINTSWACMICTLTTKRGLKVKSLTHCTPAWPCCSVCQILLAATTILILADIRLPPVDCNSTYVSSINFLPHQSQPADSSVEVDKFTEAHPILECSLMLKHSMKPSSTMTAGQRISTLHNLRLTCADHNGCNTPKCRKLFLHSGHPQVSSTDVS